MRIAHSSTFAGLVALLASACAVSSEEPPPSNLLTGGNEEVSPSPAPSEAPAPSAAPSSASEGPSSAEGTDASAMSVPTGAAAAQVARIVALVEGSDCASHSWSGRGGMPPGFTKGLALVFARSVCQQKRSDVVLASRAKTDDTVRDALAWYGPEFADLSMDNDAAGVKTLRHVYTLLAGLGMRESSGRHCVGRDSSANNVSSATAEAGAFQTSWDSNVASTELPKLFRTYQEQPRRCFLETFREDVTCNAANLKNWGTGADGLEFQRLSKECPAFSVEYAAVMMRVQGGSKGHYGPLRTKAAEIQRSCNNMFYEVQLLVEKDASVCASL